MYYSTVFLQSLGTIKNPFLMSLIFALMQIIATPWTFYLIERFGRRALLIYGALGMLVCEFIVAGVGSSLPDEKSAIVAVIVFICFVCMAPTGNSNTRFSTNSFYDSSISYSSPRRGVQRPGLSLARSFPFPFGRVVLLFLPPRTGSGILYDTVSCPSCNS